jgi:DNA gyrase subunit A
LDEDDELVFVMHTHGECDIILATRNGCAVRYTEANVRPMGRTARGVTGMRFKLDDDDIVNMEIIHEHVEDIEIDENDDASENDDAPVSGSGPQVLVITDGGMGKRSFGSTYRKTNRGAKGVVSIRLKENESVVTAVQIADDDELLMTTECGQLVRIPANEVRTVGRASKGVKIMNLNANDRITGVAKFKEVDNGKNSDNENSGESSAETADNPAEQTTENTESAE